MKHNMSQSLSVTIYLARFQYDFEYAKKLWEMIFNHASKEKRKNETITH